MRPTTVHTTISAPREEVFDYVADLANHVAFTDHFIHEFRLARANSCGLGAAARFRVHAPGAKEWVEIQFAECDSPRRIVEQGRAGRLGRNQSLGIYDFSEPSPGLTRLEFTFWTEPATRIDALRESLGARSWLKRQNQRALNRLRKVFEDPPEGELARATVAAYEPAKAARFGI